MGRGARGAGPAMGLGRGMPQEMASIHAMLSEHQKIQRSVKDIPDGVETVTTSTDPETANLIRQHTAQMKQRLEAGQPIRMWDPLFVELFRHHDQIKMQVAEVEGGVKVIETSEDPQVVLLIRQHANRGVSEFVKGGWNRMHQATTIPAGYQRG